MNLQYSSHPLNSSSVMQPPTMNPYARQSQLGQINSPLHPLNANNNTNNYHTRNLKQQQQQQQMMPPQYRGSVGYPSAQQGEDYQSLSNGKSKTSLESYQNSALTQKQISLLDKIDTIKRKGYGYGGQNEDKNSKFPPLGQLQFPNLQQYVDEKNNTNNLNSTTNPAFNQKGSMVNAYNTNNNNSNNYRNPNESTRVSPYAQNNPYSKGPYDNYNNRVNSRLPHINSPPPAGHSSQSQYDEQSQGDKRKKYQSYDINIHNSQLLNKMVENTSPPITIPNNSGAHTMQTPLQQNTLKSNQATFSPLRKQYQNPPVAQTIFSPEKANPMSQSNSFTSHNGGVAQENNQQVSTQNQLFKYTMKTKAGCTVNKVTKTNQDSAIVPTKVLTDINIIQFAVADGHGLNGHFVSQMIKRNLPKNVQRFLKPDDYTPDNIKNAITKGFATTNHELFNADFDTNLSGSTLISVFIHENKLYCANVGDSRAVIGKQKPNTSGFRAHPLSIDHKPSLEREKLRILKAGGRIDCQRDYGGQPLGPLRVWLSSMDMPGLAMTRSMGDKVGAQAGVIGEPEFEEMTITEEDKFMVVASDGVWEYLTDQEVIKMVGAFYDKGQLEQAAEKCVLESTNAWRRESLVRDDITCIVVFFNHSQNKGKASSPYY